MKNTKERLFYFWNALFNSTLVLLFAIFIISYWLPQPPVSANLRIISYSKNSDLKTLTFDPSIDLAPHFNFNTKQIFLYLTCKCSSGNEEMVWTKTIKNGDNYKIFGKQWNNFRFTADGKPDCIFELRGNIYPYVGQIKDVHYGKLKVE